MFHQGTLQSGIALAIQQQKLVACFVRDEGATSKEWEDEWLTSGWIANLLAQKAVLLRLEAGSTEAGFLAAFCEIKNAPTFIVIQNGKLQLQLGSEAGKDQFVNEIRRVCGAGEIPGASSTSASQVPAAVAEDDLYGSTEPSAPAVHTPTTVPTSTPSAKAKGKQKAASTSESQPRTSTPSTTPSAAQLAAREALRKKKRQEADELARIKGRIEADKAARKAHAEARKAERERERDGATHTEAQSQSTTSSSSRGSQAKIVHLNVRLFDGRIMRSTFPRTATLQDDVRSWVDKEFSKLGADDPNINNKSLPPYFFRHILAPQPSRELSAGDENQTLGDIDLAPSATLVLVPVKGYTEAYTDSGNGIVGTASRMLPGAFSLVSSAMGYVGNALGSVTGYGSGTQAQGEGQRQGQTVGGAQRQQQPQPESTDTPGVRVRTLADQRAGEPRQQFYNGNQLSFEPRNDDSDRR
ncbi:hypothetical protein P153DRAFT_429199 [Dothidotthia symphoricarpi CBS 119687]|uniref:UBX domain-containing protein 2 n=1 Tax=Dothidotthia symphoricarpi CBS 119687 TaxID=1392245 RepID=A0A6A6AJK1_9PLEO|nr:uncharacterized protein P153DRAFT_429199 [Dothidotthia symphoricarpi CBS 119687]KAF2131980.1 hypothetical protein P153DRAFT_429199 [Dothidotthia symphoricarpi CBS 119687]